MQHDTATPPFVAAFSDPEAVARYADGPPRFVPGFADLHRMTRILLAEQGRARRAGAGAGRRWRPGVDGFGSGRAALDIRRHRSRRAMLKQAERTLGPLNARVQLQQGYIDDAPDGPFDAATCLLTLHFLDADERRRTAREIHRRLRPGAPFVAAHSSFPQADSERARWLSRYAAYAIASGADPDKTKKARAAVEAHLSLLGPEQDAQILREAGF